MDAKKKQFLVSFVPFAIVWLIDIGLFLLQSPGSVNYAVPSVLLLVLLLVATALVFLKIHHRVLEFSKRLIKLIHQDRKSCLPGMWRLNDADRTAILLAKLVGSLVIFFLAFLFYFTVMIVLFYGLGGQLFSDPIRLMLAAFLATSIVHLSDRTSEEDGSDLLGYVFSFLLPFGTIVGVMAWVTIGSPNPWTWLILQVYRYIAMVLLFFLAYTGLDFLAEWNSGRGRHTRHGEELGQSGPNVS